MDQLRRFAARSTSIIDAFKSTFLSVFGVAFILPVLKVGRLDSSVPIIQEDSLLYPLPMVISTLFIVALAILYRIKPDIRFGDHHILNFGAAIISTVCIALLYGNYSWMTIPAHTVARVMLRCLADYILLLWAEMAYRHELKTTAIVFCLALFFLSFFHETLAVLGSQYAPFSILFFPIFSIILLYGSKSAYASETKSIMAERLSPAQKSEAVFTSRIARISFLTSLACYGFIFVFIRFAWLPVQFQEANISLLQIFYGVGVFLGASIILWLINHYWNPQSLRLYWLFALPIMSITLYLSSFTNSTVVLVCSAPLELMSVVIWFSIVISSFFFARSKNRLMFWFIAVISYKTGNAVSSVCITGFIPDFAYTGIALIILVVLSMCAIAYLIINSRTGMYSDNQSHNPEAVEPPPRKTIDGARFENSAMEASLVLTCSAISRKHQLTRREEDVLNFLARGHTAKNISDRLIISSSTAKSHISNIYTKMNIHSQQELLVIIEEESRKQSSSL